MNHNSIPLVSIWMITYNHVLFIKDALESILVQKTNFNFEVIIGDDNSDDGTAQIIKQYATKFPQIIKPIYNPTNIGMHKNTIYTLQRCTGKYIAMLEGDDKWIDDNKLQMQVDFLEKNKDVSLCFTNCNQIDKNSNVIKNKMIDFDSRLFTHIDIPFFAPTATRLMRNIIPSTIPNSFFDCGGPDTYLLTLLSLHGNIKFINKTTSAYRYHNNGIWSSKNSYEQDIFSIKTRNSLLSIASPSLQKKLIIDIYNRFSRLKNTNNPDIHQCYLHFKTEAKQNFRINYNLILYIFIRIINPLKSNLFASNIKKIVFKLI